MSQHEKLHEILSDWLKIPKMFTLRKFNREVRALVIKHCKIGGKTPEKTIARLLQLLDDYGFIDMEYRPKKNKLGRRGVYHLKQLYQDCVWKRNEASIGEQRVKKCLDAIGISYEQQKKFAKLKKKSALRIDFYFEIEGDKYAIEYDGRQHYEPVEYFGGEVAFKEQKSRDVIKESYCIKKGILMLRIPYTVTRSETIFNIVLGFILFKQVLVQHPLLQVVQDVECAKPLQS